MLRPLHRAELKLENVIHEFGWRNLNETYVAYINKTEVVRRYNTVSTYILFICFFPN